MEILFLGHYNRKMFSDGLRLVERNSPIKIILRWLALGLSLVVVGIGLYNWISTGAEIYEISRIFRHLITALLLGYYYVSPYISRWQTISKLFQAASERTMQGKVTLDGITIGPASASYALFKWETFFRKGRKEQLVALLTTSGNLALFHRDFFQSESDWQRFLQLVEQRVHEPK
jgi:hypothetical protein